MFLLKVITLLAHHLGPLDLQVAIHTSLTTRTNQTTITIADLRNRLTVISQIILVDLTTTTQGQVALQIIISLKIQAGLRLTITNLRTTVIIDRLLQVATTSLLQVADLHHLEATTDLHRLATTADHLQAEVEADLLQAEAEVLDQVHPEAQEDVDNTILRGEIYRPFF